MEPQSIIRSLIILSFLVNKKIQKQRQQRDLVLGSAMNTKVPGGVVHQGKINHSSHPHQGEKVWEQLGQCLHLGALESEDLHFPSSAYNPRHQRQSI